MLSEKMNIQAEMESKVSLEVLREVKEKLKFKKVYPQEVKRSPTINDDPSVDSLVDPSQPISSLTLNNPVIPKFYLFLP